MSNDPRPAVWNSGYFRMRAEELGDLAVEMVGEGLEGIAYGAARRAAHYGRIVLDLYRERREELIAAHPEWRLR